jgi:hypothetical protein
MLEKTLKAFKSNDKNGNGFSEDEKNDIEIETAFFFAPGCTLYAPKSKKGITPNCVTHCNY